VVSYLFAELVPSQKERLRSLLEVKHKAHGTEVVIIDNCPNSKKCKAEFLSGHSHKLERPTGKFDLSLLAKLNVGIVPMYGTFPSAVENDKNIPQVLRDYFAAWQNHDRNLLRSIFCEDATYNINGKRLLRGISAIEQYWKKNESEQEDVSWHIREFN